jgi:hypothetical protein
MIPIGQIVRDRMRSTFKIGIVIGPSNRAGKVRVCRWQTAGERWSAPVAMAEAQLEPITDAFDRTTRRGLVVAAARRAVVGGIVRWVIGGPRFSGDRLNEIANVGRTIP